MSVPAPASSAQASSAQATFAATLVDEWVRGGVGHAVVCPGSRSTPLALALAGRDEITLHVRLDERSAGFLALGIGRATCRPAVVVVTSGTAAAELHPAVVEAHHDLVPMLVCTADRPPELRDVGAPQTIDQAHLFGRAVRWFADPGVPDISARGTWRSLGSRLVAEAVSGAAGPGPVHCNLPFREPLIGVPSGLPEGRDGGVPWHRVAAAPPPPAGDVVARLAAAVGRRGVVVAGAGSGDPGAIHRLAAVLGWPVLADPRSGARIPADLTVAAADAILRDPGFVAAHRPEIALLLGASWASRVVGDWLADSAAAGTELLAAGAHDQWLDPGRCVSSFVRCDPADLCRAVLDRIGDGTGAAGASGVAGASGSAGAAGASGPAGASGVAGAAAGSGPAGAAGAGGVAGGGGVDAGWPRAWARVERAAQAAIDAVLGEGDGRTLSEPLLGRLLPGLLPRGATLVVSSSMPVRDVERYAPPAGSGPAVLANRGANGIDGVVSTALGVAAGGARPVVAMVGDLAFLHDLTAWVRPAGWQVPCVVVVVDNDGGGIFSLLPQAQLVDGPRFEQLFGTPQAVGVRQAAEGLGVPVAEVSTVGELRSALGEALARGGMGVVRAIVPDRRANAEGHRQLDRAVAGAIAAAGGRPGAITVAPSRLP